MKMKGMLIALILGSLLFISAVGCGDDDDDDSSGGPTETDDDTTDDDDDSADDDNDDNDDTGNDDDDDDDDNDDDDNDDETPDDYVAPWPQSNIEPADYDETGTPGDLRAKAVDFDLWHLENHQPYFGATVGTAFTDATRTVVSHYFDYNDSCEWTGLYLGSQSFRYHVTGDAQAKLNAIRTAEALSGNLHVNGVPGFISRYHAAQDPLIYPDDAWCDSEARCHRVEEGEYAGAWWWGETSRDMYNGWFFGMTLAYDLVDDEDMRQMIREDVTEIIDTLMDQNWYILNELGVPTDSAPHVIGGFRITWLLCAYHITGEESYKAELQKWLRNDKRTLIRLLHISFMNRYTQYFGSCLSHEYFYNLLRLSKVYFSEDDYRFFVNLFETQAHSYTRLSHNPWFNGVHMGQGDYEPEAKDDPYQEQLLEDLTDFRDAPLFRYYLPARDPYSYTLDPVSVFLHDLMVQYPFLEGIMGGVNYQAAEAFTVPEQCSTDFLFQRNPFQIEECGSDSPHIVNPGVDYLLPYWLASYHKFVTREM